MILITLKNSPIKLLVLLAIITLLGFLLFKYYQPLCEPCLPDTDCPPCRSKEQYKVEYIFGALDIIIISRIFYLAMKRRNSK